jgi:hypothetical protein
MKNHKSCSITSLLKVLCIWQCSWGTPCLPIFLTIWAELNSETWKHSRIPLVKISRDLKFAVKWLRSIISKRRSFLTTVFLTKTKPGSTYPSKLIQSLKALVIMLLNPDTYHSAKCEKPWLTKQGTSLAQVQCQNANSFIYHFLLSIVWQPLKVEATAL